MQYGEQKEDEFFQKMLTRPRLFFSDSDLENIRNKTIAIVGIGGVGCIIIELLARWGIKSFRLMDGDKYEISNMNRQIFATLGTLDFWKVDIAAKRVKEINPYANIEIFPEKLNTENGGKLIEGADILIRAADTLCSSILLDRPAKRQRIPLIVSAPYGSPNNLVGIQIRIFDYRNRSQRSLLEPFRIKKFNRLIHRLLVSTKEVFDIDNMTDEDLEKLDKDFPLSVNPGLNFVTNLAGCFSVLETIKLITGRGRTYYFPKQICIDLFNLKMHVEYCVPWKYMLKFAKNHKNQIIKNLRYLLRR